MELIARLQVAESGSRALDGELAVRFGGGKPEDLHGRTLKATVEKHGIHTFGPADWDSWLVPRYTTSVDDALALIEQKLPGGQKGLLDHGPDWCGGKPFSEACVNHTTLPGLQKWHRAPTAPLALMLALLKALPEETP